MKKLILIMTAVILTLTINAIPGTNQDFNGNVTVMTQYLDGYNNVRLSWEDNSASDTYFAYIVTYGNNEVEENFIVKGYTTEKSFAIYNNPTLPNLSNYFNVYKISFNENVELADYIPNDDGNQLRVALTWSQIKELLKRKSNNIWKITRNNIPTNLQ